jgi:hypothetical protein
MKIPKSIISLVFYKGKKTEHMVYRKLRCFLLKKLKNLRGVQNVMEFFNSVKKGIVVFLLLNTVSLLAQGTENDFKDHNSSGYFLGAGAGLMAVSALNEINNSYNWNEKKRELNDGLLFAEMNLIYSYTNGYPVIYPTLGFLYMNQKLKSGADLNRNGSERHKVLFASGAALCALEFFLHENYSIKSKAGMNGTELGFVYKF